MGVCAPLTTVNTRRKHFDGPSGVDPFSSSNEIINIGCKSWLFLICKTDRSCVNMLLHRSREFKGGRKYFFRKQSHRGMEISKIQNAMKNNTDFFLRRKSCTLFSIKKASDTSYLLSSNHSSRCIFPYPEAIFRFPSLHARRRIESEGTIYINVNWNRFDHTSIKFIFFTRK